MSSSKRKRSRDATASNEEQLAAKRERTSNIEYVHQDRHDDTIPERKDVESFTAWDQRNEAINPTEEIDRPQAELVARGYIPAFWSTFFLQWPKSTGKRVSLNLPNLAIPPLMLQPDEKAIEDLRILLGCSGFEVLDRATLAFFALGKDLDVQAAAKCFFNTYKLANTAEFKSPIRVRLEQMEADGLIEGFARHHDGTFGPLVNATKWNVANHDALYICRECLCYIFNMVDLTLLKRGFTFVLNAQNINWRGFAPFEKAKTMLLFTSSMPMPIRRRILINPGMYGTLARAALGSLLPDSIAAYSMVLSPDEVRRRYPYIVLPQSLSGSNDFIKHLSVDEQVNYKFFLDY